MKRNYPTQGTTANQVRYIGGYEYAQASKTDIRGFPLAETVEVLRPTQYALEDAASETYDPYKYPNLIPEFLNTDFEDKTSVLTFVNKYGLLTNEKFISNTGNSSKRVWFTNEESEITIIPDIDTINLGEAIVAGHCVYREGDDLANIKRQAQAIQLCFEIANIIFNDDRIEIVRDNLNKFYSIIITAGKFNSSSQSYEGRIIAIERKGGPSFKLEYAGSRGFSSNKTVDNAFYFLAKNTENSLSNQPFSVLHLPKLVDGSMIVQHVRFSHTLLGLLWDFVSSSIGNGGYMRRCANCEKWFRYKKPNARVCSSACRQAMSRRNRKVNP